MEKSKNIHIFKTKYNKYNKETIEAINETKNITKNPEKLFLYCIIFENFQKILYSHIKS